jgi:hypothetical protein
MLSTFHYLQWNHPSLLGQCICAKSRKTLVKVSFLSSQLFQVTVLKKEAILSVERWWVLNCLPVCFFYGLCGRTREIHTVFTYMLALYYTCAWLCFD